MLEPRVTYGIYVQYYSYCTLYTVSINIIFDVNPVGLVLNHRRRRFRTRTVSNVDYK